MVEESNGGTGGRARVGGCGRPFSSILVSEFVCVGDSAAGMADCGERGGGTVGTGKSLCMIWKENFRECISTHAVDFAVPGRVALAVAPAVLAICH